jgi:hypothetical protein
MPSMISYRFYYLNERNHIIVDAVARPSPAKSALRKAA